MGEGVVLVWRVVGGTRNLVAGPGAMDLINPAPQVHQRKQSVRRKHVVVSEDDREPIDNTEIFEHIRDIKDPEHPYTLEELNVVIEDNITVDDALGKIKVSFTPTVEHCSMATLIGLCVRVQLLRVLPARFKVDVVLSPGSHASENAVNRQLADKERVAAALENPSLLEMVNICLAKAN